MSGNRPMDFATLLWRHLPSVFRERDNARYADDGKLLQPGDLALLLAAYGDLLDALYRTLLQRYYDSFPESEGVDAEGLERGCQPWVLPYIARLLDVRLRSPLESGQRLEVGQAVAWRQRKGTLSAIEAITAAVAEAEVEVQEGWRRVAVSPWVGFSLLPASVFDEDPADFDQRYPDRRARHPGIPGGSVDLRRASRSRIADPGSPAAKRTIFSGEEVWWIQANPHDLPCFPGSYQDASVRTADLRTPNGRRGHAHPRRVLLYLPPFPGFFSAPPDSVQWSAIRDAVVNGEALPEGLPLLLEDPPGAPASRRLVGTSTMPVRVRGVVELEPDLTWHFENLWFDNRLEVWNGRVEFNHCAARELHIHTVDAATPVVEARGSLFKRLLAPRSLVRLEGVSILERLVAEWLEASDCIFEHLPHKDLEDDDVPAGGCLRFSRLSYLPLPPDPLDPELPNDPVWISQGKRSALRVHRCTTQAALFWSNEFGKPGCAVLHPTAHDELRFGAEDGGEMGACHDLAYSLREQAVEDKLKEYLPVGMEAVLVADNSLLCAPPVAT